MPAAVGACSRVCVVAVRRGLRGFGRKRKAICRTAGSPKKASGRSCRTKPVSKLEETLAAQIKAAGLPEPQREAKLIPGRNYRFDFAWPIHRLSVEVQGGIWSKGGHTSGTGVTRDCEKSALAMLEGFRPLSVTGDQVKSGRALAWIEALLRSTGAL